MFRLVTGLTALLLAACAPNSSLKSQGPLVGGGIRFQETSTRFQGNTIWWRTFSDPTLHQEIDAALRGNLAQKQFSARIRQASASLRGEGAALFPQLDLGSTNSLDSGSGSSSKTASFGGLLSWELDVFGRTRSGLAAQQSELQATIQDALGGRLLLTAAVAETRFLTLEQRARLKILNDQIKTNETLLDLVRLRVGQGISSRVDLLQQERQLDATRALVPGAEAEIAASEYALDVLTGRSPGSRSRDERSTLPALPGKPGAGVPSDLLKNRPDLLAQWNRILALDARAGQALADRFPRFIIGGSLEAGSLQSINAIASTILAEISAPLTDGGARHAEIDRSRAALEEAILGYSNTYLEAIRDVETALVRERKQAERIHLTDLQLATARATLEETRIRYSQALTDYLPVIDALATAQSLELSALSLRREALSLRVALHRALGGPMPHSKP